MGGIIGFCGASGSGKTTLVGAVVSQLRGRGLRVGVIKHHGHPQPLATGAGEKDSDRLLAAGAELVALSHAGGVWVFAPPAEAGPAEIAASLMPALDLVVVEGYKSADIDKIEVVAPGGEPMLPAGGRLVALARRGGAGREAGLVVLDAELPAKVADFVVTHVAQTEAPGPRVELVVNGNRLEMNPFITNLVSGAVLGLTKSLKGGENPRTIEVRLELKP